MTEIYDPQIFYRVATSLYDHADTLNKLHGEVFPKLSGTDQMAGNDDRGTTFSTEYDGLAGDIESTGRKLVSAINHYGSVVRQAGINHADAEKDSDVGDGKYDTPPPERPAPFGACYVVPSSAGGSLDGLLEDIGINDHLTVPIPDGDTDKLQTAGDAWSGLYDSVETQLSGKIAELISEFDDLSGEEIDVICDDLNELDSMVSDYPR